VIFIEHLGDGIKTHSLRLVTTGLLLALSAPATLVHGCSATITTPSGDSCGATNLYSMLLLAVLALLLRAARPA